MLKPDVSPKEKTILFEANAKRDKGDLLPVALLCFSIQNMSNLVSRDAHTQSPFHSLQTRFVLLVSKEPLGRVILERVSRTERTRRYACLIRNYIFNPEQTLRRLPRQPANTRTRH